ncbi:MAG: hydrolase [Methylobacteriaceae bacterium]|nr:hydrolase [Methylobacteriaceae bacterium]
MAGGSSGPGGPSRRALLSGAAAAGAAWLAPGRAFAVDPREAPPIVFAHGNGDHAALWMTQLWRFESNGWPRDRLTAFNFSDPLARSDDSVPQPGRSSTEDQRRELAEAIRQTQERTGAEKVAVVAASRGANAARSYAADPAGAAALSHLVLCGGPNHGVFATDANLGSEFNGRSLFLSRLNAGEVETPRGVPTLTLRSEGYDKFAQPDGATFGRPGLVTGVDEFGPALRGATNIALGRLDHREVAFHARAFREIFRFVTAQEPARLSVVPEAQPVLDGLVTGFPKATPTNRPLADATVEIWRTDPDTGGRRGDPIHQKITGPDGRWGPVTVKPDWTLEFVITAPGHPATHIYRSPFLRSTGVLHLRPGRPIDKKDAGAAAIVTMSRPRGYFGRPRDVVLLDGREPGDVTPGVPTDSVATVRLGAQDMERPIVAVFNDERIVGRGWPAAEARITILELTW